MPQETVDSKTEPASNTPNPAENAPEEKKDERSTIQYWLKWIKSSKENSKAKRHRDETKRAWAEYEKEIDKSAVEGGSYNERSYPIYWASSKTIEPAYRARTPKLCTDRRFGLNDSVALTASLIAERLATNLIESCSYDEVITKAVAEFIHGDKATVQLVYDAEILDKPVRKNLQANDDGNYLDEEGMPYDDEVFEDEQGYYGNAQSKEIGKQYISLAPACYDEVLHTPDAKCQSEILDLAFYFCLSKDEALKRFPDLEGKNVNWKTRKGDSDEEYQEKEGVDLPGKFIDGWEIWCKHTKNVYWVSPTGYPADFLDVKPDPYELKDFFPAPAFIIGSPPAKHLYPTPAYVHLAETIDQLHKCYSKVFNLIKSIRRRAIVDGSNPEVLQAFEDLGDQEFVTIQNLNALVEKGGIQNLIWYIPVQELVQAITELNALDGQFRNNFNEWFGVPDILRGVSDPLTTATAEQIASNAAHDRFRYHKLLIQKLERDAIEKMLDLALKVYSDEKIARIVGFTYMQPDQQQAFPEALALLRNDEERLIRIDIETDSTSFVNEIQDNQHRTQVFQTLMAGMKEITSMLQVSPQYAAVALHAVMSVLDGLKGSKEFTEELKGYTQQLIDQAMNPPPQEPPPDYEMLKIQVMQMSEQSKMFALQIKQHESQAALQKDNYELTLKQQAEQFQQWLQANYFRLEEQKAEMQRYEVILSEKEKMIEEQRLAQQQMIDAYKPEQPQPVPQPPPQLLQITVGEPKAKRRRIIPLRDETGEIVGADVEEIPTETLI